MTKTLAFAVADLSFCAQCAKAALHGWRGWPHRDPLPSLPRVLGRTCEVCGACEAIHNENIAWLNYHSPGSTGLPDYWLLVVAESPNKWGLPYFAAGDCPKCSSPTVVSEMRYPNGERKFKHNCGRCGLMDVL